MRPFLSSDIMPRTTINIDAPVLRDLKRLQKRNRKPIGRLVSDLLAEALGRYKAGESEAPAFSWISRSMAARIDLTDKDAVQAALEKDMQAPSRILKQE
jgi:hypothetical protein